MMQREMERLMRDDDEDEPTRRWGAPIPAASRGLVLGGNKLRGDSPAVLIAAGEVAWYEEEEELPSLQAAFERLEAHLLSLPAERAPAPAAAPGRRRGRGRGGAAGRLRKAYG